MNDKQCKNFVPAAPDVRSDYYVEPAPIRPWRQPISPPPPPAAHEIILPVEPKGAGAAVSETDRAIAFNISTAGLALIVGLGGLLVAVAGWKVPLLSVTALAIFFGLAALIWAAAWLFHAAASPDGIGLISVLLQYRLLRHEQRARLDRIDSMMERDTWRE